MVDVWDALTWPNTALNGLQWPHALSTPHIAMPNWKYVILRGFKSQKCILWTWHSLGNQSGHTASYSAQKRTFDKILYPLQKSERRDRHGRLPYLSNKEVFGIVMRSLHAFNVRSLFWVLAKLCRRLGPEQNDVYIATWTVQISTKAVWSVKRHKHVPVRMYIKMSLVKL